ncbi:heterokaryon incompatibility protein-domain-containing protein, partial [Xylaria scruposa]
MIDNPRPNSRVQVNALVLQFTETPGSAKQTPHTNPSILKLLLNSRCQEEGSVLQAELLTVDLIIGPGVVIANSKENVSYDALSYCWGFGPRDRLLELNGSKFAISSNLQAALQKLRSRTKVTYLWVDAICIDQENDKEKAAQVAMMLNIFQKATTVHAWLGEQSDDSQLAIDCLIYADAIFAMGADSLTHSSTCIARIRSVHSALSNFYERPWFCRTWIRQEVYAAARIDVHCGRDNISWDSLLLGKRLFKTIEELMERFTGEPIETGPGPHWQHHTAIDWRLDDLTRNSEPVKPRQHKPFRSLPEILASSQNFEMTDRRDLIYASLGMCGIPATTPYSNLSMSPSMSIVVDYGKTLSQVLQDIIEYMLRTSISDAFNFRASSPHQTADLLPSWIADWQHNCCSAAEIASIKKAMAIQDIPIFGHKLTWFPLRLIARFDTHDLFVAPSHARQWQVPRPLGDGSLELPARVIDYVAELTDFVCDLEWLLSADEDAWDLYQMATLGSAPKRLAKCKTKRRFDPQRDHRRLAIMRTPADTHIALVPADTAVGDFLVAVAPDVLPLVLSPKDGGSVARASEIYWNESPSEKILWQVRESLAGGDRAMGEYLQKRRKRLEKVVDVFGPRFKMKGPAFAMQGIDFLKRVVNTLPANVMDLNELQTERNWLRPIQRFVI